MWINTFDFHNNSVSFKEVAWLAQQGKGKTRILTQVILLPHTFLTTVQQTLTQSLLIPFSLLKYKGRLLFPSSPVVSLGLHDLLLSKETEMCRTDFWTLWEKARVGWSERIALKHVYYQVGNRSPAHVGCMKQVLRAGALGRPRGMGWGGRREGGSGWRTHVNPWLIHVNVWQKPLQCCKVISLQLIKINEKNKIWPQTKKCHASVTSFSLNNFPWSLSLLPNLSVFVYAK